MIFDPNSVQLCRWQHLKSNTIHAWIQEQELSPSILVEDDIKCHGCGIDLIGLKELQVCVCFVLIISEWFFKIFGKEKRGLHHFCKLDCATTFSRQVKQNQWEDSVTKNKEIRLSTSASTDQ